MERQSALVNNTVSRGAARVLIIANNLLARVGLAAMLNEQQDILVMGQLADSRRDDDEDTLLDDLEIYRPDVVVYDLGYDPALLLSRLALLVEAQMPVIGLLPDEDAALTVMGVFAEADAYGLLLRDSNPGLLVAAVQAICAGLVALDPSLAMRYVGTPRPAMPQNGTAAFPAINLTPRESEVLQLLAEGLPNKTIAISLGISPNTVKFHVNSILAKLNAQSRTEAAVRAAQLGLLML